MVGLPCRDDADHIVTLPVTMDDDKEVELDAETKQNESVFIVRVFFVGD